MLLTCEFYGVIVVCKSLRHRQCPGIKCGYAECKAQRAKSGEGAARPSSPAKESGGAP